MVLALAVLELDCVAEPRGVPVALLVLVAEAVAVELEVAELPPHWWRYAATKTSGRRRRPPIWGQDMGHKCGGPRRGGRNVLCSCQCKCGWQLQRQRKALMC